MVARKARRAALAAGFGLVLGATPIGDGLYSAVAAVGVWLTDAVAAL